MLSVVRLHQAAGSAVLPAARVFARRAHAGTSPACRALLHTSTTSKPSTAAVATAALAATRRAPSLAHRGAMRLSSSGPSGVSRSANFGAVGEAAVSGGRSSASKLALGVAAGAGVVALAVAGKLATEQPGVAGTKWYPTYVRERLGDAMTALGGGIALTGATAVAAYRAGALRFIAGSPMAFGIGSMVVSIGSMIVCISTGKENPALKLGSFALFNAAMGLSLVPLSMAGGAIIIRAAAMTAGIVGSLSLVAANSPSDQFLWMGGPLAIGLGAVFVSSLGAAFLPAAWAVVPLMHNISLYGGLAVFSGFVLYDTSRIVEHATHLPEEKWDPVGESISVYLDAVNIFTRMVVLLSGGGSRRK